MKRLKFLLLTVICVAVLLCVATVTASADVVASGNCGAYGADVTYSLDDSGTLTISGMGNMKDYYSESSVPWYSIRAGIKNVIIEDGVTSIGYGAFYDCSALERVTIPDSITSIGSSAFYGSDTLTSITIPDSVTYIGYVAFEYCTALSNITISKEVTTIGNYTFEYCTSLSNITIPESVTTIGNKAFHGCTSLANITIPDGVTSIGDSAFWECSALESVTFPDSVTSIGEWVFYNCTSLTSITIPDGVTSIGSSAFYCCDSLKSVAIPDSVTSIGVSAFWECSALESVTIPDSVTSIGVSAFWKCSALESVTISDSVTTIGSYAFSYCSALESVTIPDSVTTIDSNAFFCCSALESVTISNSVTTIGEYAFYGCDALTVIDIPNNVTKIGESAFASCDSLSTVILGDGIESINEYAFANCFNLQTVGYTQDATMKENIVIRANNEKLLNAKWYYNFCKTTHTYSGDCDAICNICEFPREVNASHTYTNSCDDTCNICGYVTAITHTFTDDCDSVCNICSFEREIVYDHTITTDENITLSYSTNLDASFIVSDESIAHITSTGMSSIVVGSYVSKTVSATITPKKPGGVIVSVVDSYNNVLAKSLLLVVEGEHQFELSKTISVRDCVTPGKAVYVCKFCAFEKEEYEEAYGHSYLYGCDSICNRCDFVRTDISHDNTKSVAEVKATCTTKGYTAGVFCNDCQKYISGHTEIPVDTNAHKWDNGTITTIATCKVSGVKTYTCQHNASHIKTENLGINASNHINTKNVAAVKATCTTKGYTAGIYCNDCQKYISGHTEIAVDANAHKWDNGTITTTATCMVNGIKTYTCLHNASHKKTENLGVNASNHVNTKNVAEVKATCTTKGSTAGVYCNDCQKYISGHKEVAKNTSNHINTNNVAEVPATTESVGYTEGVYCNDCKKYISGHKEIPKLTIAIGDLDGNGKITAADARLALRASVGLENLDSAQKNAADIDGNGVITAADARLILRASVGLEEPKEWLVK